MRGIRQKERDRRLTWTTADCWVLSLDIGGEILDVEGVIVPELQKCYSRRRNIRRRNIRRRNIRHLGPLQRAAASCLAPRQIW